MANLLEKASIVLTPTGYSEDAIHNVKPSSEPFGDMTFIQNGTTTRIDENGLVVDNVDDVPRIDYSKGSGAILSEISTVNQLRYSEDLTQSSVWSGCRRVHEFCYYDRPKRKYKFSIQYI